MTFKSPECYFKIYKRGVICLLYVYKGIYKLKKERLKRTQLEKVRLIKVNELKLTQVELF